MFRDTLLATLTAAALTAGACNFALAQSSPDVVRERISAVTTQMSHGRHLGDVALSPDGHRIAFVERTAAGAQLFLAPVENLTHPVTIQVAHAADARCGVSAPRWIPDGKALLFLSDCDQANGQTNLFLSRLDGKSAQRLSELKGEVQDPAISPDGRSVAFLYVEGATRHAGALAAMKPWSGVIGEDGIEIQRLARVAIPASGSKVSPAAAEWISPATLHLYEFDWRPDSKGVAFVAANPPGENNWWVAKLYTEELGAAPKVVLAPAEVAGALHGLQIAVPRWNPDGSSIAVIGGLMSDQGSTGGDVWLVPVAGGAPVDLTPNRTSTPQWIEWKSPRSLFVAELAGGAARLFELDPTTAKASDAFFAREESIGDGRFEMSLSATADHTAFAFTGSSFAHPGEIYLAHAVANGKVEELSHFNGGIKPVWGEAQSLTWKNENFTVQGWLMEPKDFNPAKKYPLLVIVHGGPAAAATARWSSGSLSAPIFSALGYFVLEANPRGSFGQGEAFTQANRKDFGRGDLRDILAGVDAALAKYPIDPQRVGVAGWSYGGFMSMFSVTQTDRFKASVAGAGIANWQSYYGENSIDQWMQPYFGASVYDDPAVYGKASAINYIDQVKTPTLVVVGDRDGECPAPQSFEFWHALKARGVATQLVVYPNEGHGFVDPNHRRDVLERAAAWLEQYLGAGPR